MIWLEDGTLLAACVYEGHPIIAGGPKLPIGGSHSEQTWYKCVHELRNYCAYSQHLLNIIETVLSIHMLAEAFLQANIIK